MGEVYRAESAELGRAVAVKRMLEQAAGDQDLLQLFLREVMVASTLEHHNVVEVLDVGRSHNELFLVMELVEGPTLAEVLQVLRGREERVPIPVACGIATQVAQGLAHAHERALPDGTPLGIVHRDIAPENVLIGLDGVPKLVDFGLAKLDGQTLTQPGVIRGRPRSLAPEQARGEATDPRTDIFALGSILFEMTSGQKLYPDEAIASLLWRVAEGDYEAIGPRMGDIDVDLVGIVERAVAVDPANRQRSARQLERELGAFQASRELRVSQAGIAELMNSVWPDVLALRQDALEGTAGELEERQLTLPADEFEPFVESDRESSPEVQVKRWIRPAQPPRPAGWDKVIPAPSAPAHLFGPGHKRSRGWWVYGAVLVALAVAVFMLTWWAGGGEERPGLLHEGSSPPPHHLGGAAQNHENRGHLAARGGSPES